MINIGITGQAGFIGTHLFNTICLDKENFTTIGFEDAFFSSEEAMDDFVGQCDVIIHLAAMNRHADPAVIYETNIMLVNKLVSAMERTHSQPYVIMSSSLQEERDNLYGRSKRDGRELLNLWAERNDARFTGLIIPNVFGPFGVPFYNSVISTFSHQIVNEQVPKIETDAELKLIYINDLVSRILQLARSGMDKQVPEQLITIEHQQICSVTELLAKLRSFHETYVHKGIFPDLQDYFDVCLFNTFRSYLPNDYYPRKYLKHSDNRGDYVEITRSLSAGQSAFSTTKPGVTRGNHFHIRKVERFAVIQGIASIKLRKYGTDEVIEYIIDANEPAYVDMPVWYTHNLTNIGSDELVTLFWINEFYDPSDPDTYFEQV